MYGWKEVIDRCLERRNIVRVLVLEIVYRGIEEVKIRFCFETFKLKFIEIF